MREIHHARRVRRVLIFRRDDGKWSFVEEHFSAHTFEMCGVPQREGVSICATFKIALVGSAKACRLAD